VDAGGFWWVLVDAGGSLTSLMAPDGSDRSLWWVLVGSGGLVDSGGFWWILVRV
jgi:fumarate reductase subunit D